MKFSARLQLLTCLMLYASSAQAIMVKYGTKGGPIEPPAPEPSQSPQPYRDPAPVWEERSNDTPDPNAQWRPFFIPLSRHTSIVTKISTTTPQPLNDVQRFVNTYIPQNKQSVRAANPAYLSSHNVPGVGLRYFFPAYSNVKMFAKQDDAKLNHIDADFDVGKESASDFQWKYEKDSMRRIIRHNQEGAPAASRIPGYVYQFPAYVQPQHR